MKINKAVVFHQHKMSGTHTNPLVMSENIDKRNTFDYHNIMYNSTSCNPFIYEIKMMENKWIDNAFIILYQLNHSVVEEALHTTDYYQIRSIVWSQTKT